MYDLKVEVDEQEWQRIKAQLAAANKLEEALRLVISEDFKDYVAYSKVMTKYVLPALALWDKTKGG